MSRDPSAALPASNAPSTRLLEALEAEVHQLLEALARRPRQRPGHSKAPEQEGSARGQDPAAGQTFDRDAFALWILLGLRLFEGETPSWREANRETRQLLTWLAYARCRGNITRMARRLGTGRRAVRQVLRDMKAARSTATPSTALSKSDESQVDKTRVLGLPSSR